MCHHPGLAGPVARLTSSRMPLGVLADGMQHSWTSYSETFASFIAAAPSDAWLSQRTSNGSSSTRSRMSLPLVTSITVWPDSG